MWKLLLLHNSKFNNFLEYCVICHFLIPARFIITVLLTFDWVLISVLCRTVTLIITDSQKCKWKIMKSEEIEK